MATEVIKVVDPDSGTGFDYSSLAAWEADYGGAGTGDIVSLNKQVTAKCRCTNGTTDGPTAIDAFTTDVTRFVKIWTDPSESYRSTTGVYTTGNKYRITGSNTNLLVINVKYIKIHGLQF